MAYPFKIQVKGIILVMLGFLTMMINGLRNRRFGPGGGTRRLHHEKIWGRNRIDVRNKGMLFIRYSIRRIGLNKINAKPTMVSMKTLNVGAMPEFMNAANTQFGVAAAAA